MMFNHVHWQTSWLIVSCDLTTIRPERFTPERLGVVVRVMWVSLAIPTGMVHSLGLMSNQSPSVVAVHESSE